MKKVLFLLLTLPLFLACSSDDKEEKGVEPDGNTFIEIQIGNYPSSWDNCILGYKDGDIFKIAAKFGSISSGKPSKELKIKEGVNEVYVFGDYLLIPSRVKEPFKITSNIKNIIVLDKEADKIIVDVTNPKEYPIN